MLRLMYEKFNVYIYVIIPALLIAGYLFLNNKYGFCLSKINNYNDYKFEFTYSMLALLLTLLGLMQALPSNRRTLRYRKLMKKYKHDEIIYNTLFIGIVASISFIILYMIEKYPGIQDILFITMMIEIIISSCWLFITIRNINKLE